MDSYVFLFSQNDEEEDEEEEEEDEEKEEEDVEEEVGRGSVLPFKSIFLVAGALLLNGSIRGPAFFFDFFACFSGIFAVNICPGNLAALILLNISRLKSSFQTLPDSSP